MNGTEEVCLYQIINVIIWMIRDFLITEMFLLELNAMNHINQISDTKNDISVPQFLSESEPLKGYGIVPEYEGEGIESVVENYGDLKSYVIQEVGASEQDYRDYAQKLIDNGYEFYYSAEAKESRFSTYTDGYSIVNLSYVEYNDPFSDGEVVKYINIAVECTENISLPPLEDDSTHITELQVSVLDAHNTWLIRLEDGRFIMVDGGLEETYGRNNADSIYNQLVAQNVLEGKPIIAAWLITHPHSDHVNAFYQFAQKYNEDVELQMIVANMPNKSAAETLDKFSRKICDVVSDYYTGVKFVVAHIGQRFAFAGLELDVLFTHENLYSVEYGNTNLSSSVFSMRMPGGRLIITGDQQQQGCKILNAIYRDELKCDMVQFCHHGYTGGDTEMYLSMAARVGYWPFNYEELKQNNVYGKDWANHIPLETYDFHLVMSQSEEVMMLLKETKKEDLKQFRKWEES